MTLRRLKPSPPWSHFLQTFYHNRPHFRSQHLLMERHFLRTAENMSEPYVKERSFNAFLLTFTTLPAYTETSLDKQGVKHITSASDVLRATSCRYPTSVYH